MVGICPGGSIDNVGNQPTPFGRDLVQDTVLGPTALGAGRAGFELFDHGNGTPPMNPMNFIIAFGFNNGSDIGPGIVYFEDPSFAHTSPTTSGYVIQP